MFWTMDTKEVLYLPNLESWFSYHSGKSRKKSKRISSKEKDRRKAEKRAMRQKQISFLWWHFSCYINLPTYHKSHSNKKYNGVSGRESILSPWWALNWKTYDFRVTQVELCSFNIHISIMFFLLLREISISEILHYLPYIFYTSDLVIQITFTVKSNMNKKNHFNHQVCLHCEDQ